MKSAWIFLPNLVFEEYYPYLYILSSYDQVEIKARHIKITAPRSLDEKAATAGEDQKNIGSGKGDEQKEGPISSRK